MHWPTCTQLPQHCVNQYFNATRKQSPQICVRFNASPIGENYVVTEADLRYKFSLIAAYQFRPSSVHTHPSIRNRSDNALVKRQNGNDDRFIRTRSFPFPLAKELDRQFNASKLFPTQQTERESKVTNSRKNRCILLDCIRCTVVPPYSRYCSTFIFIIDVRSLD